MTWCLSLFRGENIVAEELFSIEEISTVSQKVTKLISQRTAKGRLIRHYLKVLQ